MKTGKRRRWLVGLVLAAAVGGLVYAGTLLAGRGGLAAEPPAPRQREAVAVTVERVTARPVRRTVTVIGSLYGRNEVTVSPKVEGRIIRVHHDVGDVVRPGAVLLEIDPTDFELAVAEARRALELELVK